MESNKPLIEGTYRVIGEIGSGAGGIVYLAEHLRLGKKVVLKVDKRELSTKPEVLRREVDALKNLSHTYIPQVYDFIVEDGTICTVMDYIDGESFDKLFEKGACFSQAQVVGWACQLLEALAYLHTRPPHGVLHSDIKPANIMLTPQGDIRLIDFNIALALGEEGTIAVGRSFGYASPEHYIREYSPNQETKGTATEALTDLSDVETVLEKSTLNERTRVLDVRSDIYSLGATLYHFLTGERPAKNAADVKALSTKDFSPAVVSILSKAMNPNPNLRWQTAEEMLFAFEHLRENDLRTKRFKKTVAVTAASLTAFFLAGGFTIFVGLKQMEQLQNAYVLAEYSEDALRKGDVDLAISYALQALPEKHGIFTPPNTAEAQKALTDALNIYDLSDGFKEYKTVELPSAPLDMAISTDGKIAVCIYSSNLAIFDTDTAKIIAILPTEHSALAEVEFVDNHTIVYAGANGIKAYDILENTELWSGKPATGISVSSDGRIVAAVYKDENIANVYEIATGQILQEVDFEGKAQLVTVNDIFANPKDSLFAVNHDGTLLGVSFEDGSLFIFDLLYPNGGMEIFDETSSYTHFEGGFHESYFAFSATNSSESVFSVIDTVEKIQTGGFGSEAPYSVQADKGGIFVQTDNLLVKIHPVTGEQIPLVTTVENIIGFASDGEQTMITSKNEFLFFDKQAKLMDKYKKEYGSDFVQIKNGIALVGSLDSPIVQILKYESHPETGIFDYNPDYTHDEARVSTDGETVMLFSYEGFQLYKEDGTLVKELMIPNADRLYDQQYRRDKNGSRLELIYNDGLTQGYSAEDGSLLYENVEDKPDISLKEAFYTDELQITSSLHGTPAAYDIKTGKLVRELEKDAYLTYVTQLDEYIVTQYVTSEGDIYGLLLNQECETLAYLPYLCDVIENKLIFDCPSGNLRESRIYNIEELRELARNQLRGGTEVW